MDQAAFQALREGMSTSILQSALSYSERGFSVIPVKPDKKPYIKWEPYQTTKAKADEIMTWFTKWPESMIGLVTGKISDLFVIDCDTREGCDLILKKLPNDIGYPMAQTPRGGWHLYFQNFEQSKTATGIIPGVDIRGEGGYIIAPPSVNAECKAYSWMPGFSLDDFAPPPLNCEPLKASIINNNNSLYKGDVVNSVVTAKFFTEGRRDDDLFHAANSLIKSGCDIPYVRQVLEMLARTSNPPFPENEVRSKIESALKRTERHERNLTAEIREWVLTTTGNFLSTDVNKELQLTTRDNMKVAAVVLGRLCDGKDPLIERYGNKRGSYRRIENDMEALDWRNAETNPLNLIWPFGIHNLVNVYPGNIGVIAEFPNSGKTAFIHNFIKFNQDQHDVHLFSSEGGPEELKMRLSKFDCPLSEWKFKAWERTGDFADVIKPDAINIIDYLEIHDDFYKVGGMIKAISDKLKNGFALIAIQKNGGRDEGLGGARGLEKPRLYMAMDSGKLKIVKAKSWVDSNNNPNGLSVKFNIVDGCKFVIKSEWERSE